MKVNGIEFMFLGDSFLVKDRGRAYTAKLIGRYTATQIKEALLGQEIPATGKRVLGVEMFAIEHQSDTPISLLFEK